MGDLRVTQTSSQFAPLVGVQSMLQATQYCSVRQPEMLRQELWCTETAFSDGGKCGFTIVIIDLRSGTTLLNFWHCKVRDGWSVWSLYRQLPRLVRCLSSLLQIQPGNESICIISGVGKSGSGRFDQSVQPRQQRLLRQESGYGCIPNLVQNSRLGRNENFEVCWAGNIARSFAPNTSLTGAEWASLRTVFNTSWKESSE